MGIAVHGANREFFPRSHPFCKLYRVTFFQIPVMYSDKVSRNCGKGDLPCLSSSNGSSSLSLQGLHGSSRDIPSNIFDRIGRSTSSSGKKTNTGHRSVTVTLTEGWVTVIAYFALAGHALRGATATWHPVAVRKL
jgi:hypothetical protein